ncbi:hypothetical protein AB0K80_08075 [Streptomyces sp. NPDC052682]|uniref:hypothetical protein n=1 Tax=Streptomyces sp. NPDC052682 TaxID=3154954 RepID=UPI0034247F59
MRKGLVPVLAWLLATGAAATLSWWGVHTVLAGTAYDPPRALPVTAAGAASREPEPPTPSPRRTAPAKSPSPKPPVTREPSAPAPPATPTARPSRSPAPSPSATGQVRSYDTEGGRAVFDLGETSASLVSATPAAGWSMQMWKTQTWIRVEFASGADRVSVFCTWHDGPPRVDIGTY